MKKLMILLMAALLMTGCTAAESKKQAGTDTEKKEVSEEKQELKESDIKKGVVLNDLVLIKDVKDFDFVEILDVNKELIKSVKADSSKVDFTKPGTYDLTYTIVVDLEKLNRKDAKDTLTVKKKVEIVSSEDAKKRAASGEKIYKAKGKEAVIEVAAAENKEKTIKEEKAPTEAASVESSATPGSSNESGGSYSGYSDNSGSGYSGEGNGNVSSGTAPAQQSRVWHEPVYEQRWVVDVAGHYEQGAAREVIICFQCGTDITNNIEEHYILGTCGSGYYADLVYQDVWVPEVGHYENVLVRDGYWE